MENNVDSELTKMESQYRAEAHLARIRILQFLDKVFIPQKHLPLELLPRRRRLDAVGHELGVTCLRQTAARGKLRQ